MSNLARFICRQLDYFLGVSKIVEHNKVLQGETELNPSKNAWPTDQARDDVEPHTSMSVLGQKQTCAAHQHMSALPPIVTAKTDFRTRSEGSVIPGTSRGSQTRLTDTGRQMRAVARHGNRHHY
jgi:hypothetical protein